MSQPRERTLTQRLDDLEALCVSNSEYGIVTRAKTSRSIGVLTRSQENLVEIQRDMIDTVMKSLKDSLKPWMDDLAQLRVDVDKLMENKKKKESQPRHKKRQICYG